MDPLDRFFAWVLRNPIWAASIVIWIVLTVRAKLKEAAEAQQARQRRNHPTAAPGPAASPERAADAKAREGESDLEARVRRNFEEMLRRRQAAAQPTSNPAAPAGVPAAAAARPAPRPATRAPIDYDEGVRPEPTSTEPTRHEGPRTEVVVRRKAKVASRHLEAAAHAVRGTVRSAGSERTAKHARAQALRRGILEPATLRRAVILRELLDPPIALR